MPTYGAREGSLRSRIADLHKADCNRSLRSIATEVGCDVKYVSTVYSQLGLYVGEPYSVRSHTTDTMASRVREPWSPKRAHNVECVYIRMVNRRPEPCREPTGGKNYCPDCQNKTQSVGGTRYKMFGYLQK